jgi:hypothetical protein
MCSPISVVTGGTVNVGCTGICQVWPQTIGLIALAGVLIWSLRNMIFKKVRG